MLTQDDGCGQIIMSAPASPASAVFRCGLRGFPARQALVRQLDRQAELFFQPPGKARRFGSHFAFASIQVQRSADHDAPNLVLADESAKPAHILMAIFSFQRQEWPRRQSQRITNGQAKPFPAIVYRQHSPECDLAFHSAFPQRRSLHEHYTDKFYGDGQDFGSTGHARLFNCLC
jgi:hypothetical protein